jgi:ParB family transcriptional regulator, chromosome partitioning protein
MSRRSTISTLIQEQLAAANSAAAPGAADPPARVTAGPVRTMGLTLERMELERKSLEAAVAEGGAVVELDPAAVEGSFAADRFAEAADPAFEALKASIAASGQEVPILVRPMPERPGRYQAAYGHRRLRACRQLGIKVRALVKPLTDAELVVAQGLENSARVDLTFIEKASFALALERRGFDRATIMAALATDKTELSKMLSAAAALPEGIVRAIGPAPKAGRRRWLLLAERLESAPARERVEALVADPAFGSFDTDLRFTMALDAALASMAEKALRAPFRTTIRSPAGEALAKIEETDSRLNLVMDRRGAKRRFADYVVRSLPDLYATFAAEEAAPKPPGARRR